MKKLGTHKNPIILRANSDERIQEITAICKQNNWQFICEISYDEPEDISELEYMLNPKDFDKLPKMKNLNNLPIVNNEPVIGRNDPCPCGSGKKYKQCHG